MTIDLAFRFPLPGPPWLGLVRGARAFGLPVSLLALAVLVLRTSPVDAQTRTITVVGTIVDSATLAPLERAVIYVPNGKWTETDGRGRFRLAGARPVDVVLVRRIGYHPRSVDIRVNAGEALVADIGTVVMAPLAIALDSINVEAEWMESPKLVDFYRRRRGGMGRYLSPGEIWTRNPVVSTDLLRFMPGVTVICPGSIRGGLEACTAATTRRGRPCPMQVVLDGIPTSMALDEIPTMIVTAVEVYSSAAFSPLEIPGRSACGKVVVWTGGHAP